MKPHSNCKLTHLTNSFFQNIMLRPLPSSTILSDFGIYNICIYYVWSGRTVEGLNIHTTSRIKMKKNGENFIHQHINTLLLLPCYKFYKTNINCFNVFKK